MSRVEEWTASRCLEHPFPFLWILPLFTTADWRLKDTVNWELQYSPLHSLSHKVSVVSNQTEEVQMCCVHAISVGTNSPPPALPCGCISNSIDHSPFREANSRSVTQDIPCPCETWRFITLFTESRHCPYPEPNRLNPHSHTLFV
jgi:hypothetical protein